MRAVWKFPLDVVVRQDVQMPVGAQILHVDEQQGRICLWAGVTPSNSLEPRTILIVGTGHVELPDTGIWHLGTVQIGEYVFHVFELEEDGMRSA